MTTLRLVSAPSEKTCAKCSGTRFYANGACRECSAQRSREWRKQNPEAARALDKKKAERRRHDPAYRERKNARTREYRAENRDALRASLALLKEQEPVKHRLYALKSRALKAGIPCSIEVDDIVIPNFCPVLGIPITREDRRDPGYWEIDRFVPELGYVPGNVTVISRRANLLKSNGTLHEHEKVVEWMRRYSERSPTVWTHMQARRGREERRNGRGTGG